MSMPKKILILIPAYNESRNIAAVIAKVRSQAGNVDVLVVDDGSKDGTAQVAQSSGAAVVSHPFNMGYGVAIQTGYKYALRRGYDYLVQIDADGQHDPASISALLTPLEKGEVDFVLGSRFLHGGTYRPSLARRAGMMVFRAIVNFVTRANITDCTSGYQAFNREVIEFFTRDIFPCDYPDADVLVGLHRARFRVKEVAVTMYESQDGKSMHSGVKPVYYVLKMHLAILVTLIRSSSYFKRGA